MAEVVHQTEMGDVHIPLDGVLSIGRSRSNALYLAAGDVSGKHAVIERVGIAWCIQDLNSSNGTFVNGTQVHESKKLEHDDMIRIASVILRFSDPSNTASTRKLGPAPVVTAREKDVLRELCRQYFEHVEFPQAASVHQIAERLCVGDQAVKAHLENLYPKYGILVPTGRRQALYEDAIRRRGVTPEDYA